MPARKVAAEELIIAADYTRTGDRAIRLSQEIRYFAQQGTPPALLQTRLPRPGECIAPAILACLRNGWARTLQPDEATRCTTLVFHEPDVAEFAASGLGQLAFEVAHVVCHRAADVEALPRMPMHGRIRKVYVTNPFVAPRRRAGGKALPTWMPILPGTPETAAPAPCRARQTVIWISGGVTCTPPAALAEAGVDVLTLGGDSAPDPVPGDVAPDRLLARADLFVLAPDHPLQDLPDALISLALLAGKPVLLPSRVKGHYGIGPKYYTKASLVEDCRVALTAPQKPGAEPDFVAACRGGPVTKLAPSAPKHSRTNRPLQKAKRPVLMLPSNGVGVGHLTRLLAVARRMHRPVVFGSQAPALDVIRQFGFDCDYIPSHTLVGGDFDAWDRWFGAEVARLLDRHDPALVVYDGNHPSDGLIAAVAARPDCGLAWMRRGMWARTTSRFLKNARWCDIVIEPGELAGARDEGVTSRLRHEATAVDPIRLLDPEDLLERGEAARALGLDPARPAVLVQLGSGFNRDLLTLLDGIISELSRHDGLQIALAEWVTGSVPLNLWPEVTVLRGFPISRHFRAFDFCVSAAGYNSFHELLGFNIPTIFVANQHPSMDDQYGRAKFAQDHSAAFEISEAEMDDFPDLVAMLIQGAARRFLSDHCKEIGRPNGAAAAAQALERAIMQRSGGTR